MKLMLYAGCGLAMLCSACTSDTDSDTPDGGPGGPGSARVPAATPTLQQMLVGKTTLGNFLVNGAFSNAFCDYYAPDGTITSVALVGDAREERSGTYSLDGDQVCVTYPAQAGGPTCHQVIAKQSTGDPNVWGGDFVTPDGTVQSHVVTAEGNQVARCH